MLRRQGRNANYTDISGSVIVRSLASLSLEAPTEMIEDSMFNFFRHGFLSLGEVTGGAGLGLFDDKAVGEYANTLALDLIELGKSDLVADSALVMNVWMYVVHSLYDVSRACQRSDASSTSGMQIALDAAAALWIGVGQDEGDNASGNMLYNMAETAGSRFGQDVGETLINTLIIAEFDKIKLAIGTGTCATPEGYEDVRLIVRNLIGLMTVPLVQNVIHFIMEPASTTNSDNVELYALSFAPRIEACMPDAFQNVLDMFVLTNAVEGLQEAGVALVQSVYTCLEVTCDLVGNYRSGEVPVCSDPSDGESLMIAGYDLSIDAYPVSAAAGSAPILCFKSATLTYSPIVRQNRSRREADPSFDRHRSFQCST